MSNLAYIISSHLLPFILLLIPFFLLFDVSLKTTNSSLKKHSDDNKEKLNTKDLENKLKHLIEENHQKELSNNLITTLSNKPQKIISSYINTDKPSSKGFHFFQHIFSLIKNRTPDEKIIKTLRLYFPSCASSHLFAMLKSFKAYLNILQHTPHSKYLINSLNNNNLKPTLIFLEQRLSSLLNELHQNKTDDLSPKAAKYCLIFASFSEFYSKDLTLKILNLAQNLSPTLFKEWHQGLTKQKERKIPFSATIYKKNKKNS